MIRKRTAWLALIVALGLVAASCGSDDDSESASGDASLPGEGVSAIMGKADWTTEDPNAYVLHNLMEELGYEVTDPADLELGPSNGYIAMAQGDMDFWVNGWFPGHNSWLENELPDGSAVGDHVSITGEMMLAGGLQGILVTKSFAEEYNLTSLDDFNANPDAIAAYDAQDPLPGNGVADIYGCQESWTCDDIITAQIAFSGWDNIAQTIAGYDAMVAEAVTKADAGEPMIIYTWTPSRPTSPSSGRVTTCCGCRWRTSSTTPTPPAPMAARSGISGPGRPPSARTAAPAPTGPAPWVGWPPTSR